MRGLNGEITVYDCCTPNPNAGVRTAASVHLRGGLEDLVVLERMSRDAGWADEIIEHDSTVKDGVIEAQDEPELGVTFDPDTAREYPEEPTDSHSLFDEKETLKRPCPVQIKLRGDRNPTSRFCAARRL